MRKLLFLMVLAGFTFRFSAAQEVVKIGERVPLFCAVDDDGQLWNLGEFLGRKNIVLYFFPAAMTGGCTKQACGYRDNLGALKGFDAEVVGISGDDPESLQVFRKEHHLNFTLLSDPEGKIARLFGVPVGSGGKITRLLDDGEVTLNRGVTMRRWTFVIGKNGEIKYVNQQVDAANDYKAVMEVLGSK